MNSILDREDAIKSHAEATACLEHAKSMVVG